MFENKVALITGASRGIGFAIAQEIMERGGRVCLTARKQDELEAALVKLEANGRAFAVAGSSHDGEHRGEAVRQVLERFGSLDMLVNNAATNPHYGPLVEADLGAVEKILEVNVLAPIGWIQEIWRAWMRERGGVVLNVASVGGLRNLQRIGAYNVSKAALIHLTRQLALELAPNVRVNAIAPGLVKTRFSQALYEGREAEAASGCPLKRLGTPEDTARIARFLLSEEASWITGETVVVDGGGTLVTAG